MTDEGVVRDVGAPGGEGRRDLMGVGSRWGDKGWAVRERLAKGDPTV